MSDLKRFIAIDLGAESGRLVLGEIENNKISLTEIHRFPTGGTLINGHLHWNIINFYSQIIEGLKTYSRLYGKKLDGIGVDTWGVDYGLLDKSGNLCGIPYMYRDSRSIGMDELIDKKIGNVKLYDLTGIQLLSFNTVNQILSMVESCDSSLEIADKLLFIADLLNYFLTGKAQVEYTVASISQLINPRTMSWEPEIFKKLGIPEIIMTNIIKAGDKIGDLRPEIANEVGLDPVMILAPAEHDTASAAVAIPTDREKGWAFLSSGTWSILGIELDKPIINDKSYEMNISNSAGALDKTLYLKNVMGLWILQCCKKEWNKTSPDLSYQMIEDMAENTTSVDIFINPDDPCFLNPTDAIQTIVDFVQKTGQGRIDKSNIALIARIIFESLALKYRYVIEHLILSTGESVEILYITGGGSKNKLLNQLTANALKISVVAGPVEATAIGNIMMLSIGIGLYSSLKEIRNVVINSFELNEFNHFDKDIWDIKYEKFLKLMN